MEKIIIDTKNEFLQFFVNILTPHIYMGIHSMYNNAVNLHKQLIDNNVKSHPGILKLFQLCLKDLPSLNSNAIDIEVARIKNAAKCSEWIEHLLRSIIKSYIIIITINSTCDNFLKNYHEQIFFKDFIHKCYIECAHEFYNNPEIFWHEIPILNLKKNQKNAQEIIKLSIVSTIKKMLPLNLLLTQYLNSIIPNIENILNNDSDNDQLKNNHLNKIFSQKISDIKHQNNKKINYYCNDELESNDISVLSSINKTSGVLYDNYKNIPHNIKNIRSNFENNNNKQIISKKQTNSNTPKKNNDKNLMSLVSSAKNNSEQLKNKYQVPVFDNTHISDKNIYSANKKNDSNDINDINDNNDFDENNENVYQSVKLNEYMLDSDNN